MPATDTRRDESWVPVATVPGGDPGRSLQPIHDVLQAAGVPVGFDPYRPGDASSVYPYPQRAFSVVVPESLHDEAVRIVREAGIAIPGEVLAEPAASHGPQIDRSERRRQTTTTVIVIVLIVVLLVTLLETVLRVFGERLL